MVGAVAALCPAHATHAAVFRGVRAAVVPAANCGAGRTGLLRDEARVKEIMFELRHHTFTTRFVLDIFGLDLLNHSITDVAGFPVLNIRSTPMIGINRLVKAIEDRFLAFIIF